MVLSIFVAMTVLWYRDCPGLISRRLTLEVASNASAKPVIGIRVQNAASGLRSRGSGVVNHHQDQAQVSCGYHKVPRTKPQFLVGKKINPERQVEVEPPRILFESRFQDRHHARSGLAAFRRDGPEE
jgi:hypothetical protein